MCSVNITEINSHVSEFLHRIHNASSHMANISGTKAMSRP